MKFNILPPANAINGSIEHSGFNGRLVGRYLKVGRDSCAIEGHRLFLDGVVIWERGTSNWHNLDHEMAFGYAATLVELGRTAKTIKRKLAEFEWRHISDNNSVRYWEMFGRNLMSEKQSGAATVGY